MEIKGTSTLDGSVRRLFPNVDRDQALAELLLERAQKNLIKYQTAARRYEEQYGRSFEGFRQTILQSEPDETVEQDYFDWELAVTGILDMQEEIDRLGHILASR